MTVYKQFYVRPGQTPKLVFSLESSFMENYTKHYTTYSGTILMFYISFLETIIIPPAKRSFRGVYCFQPVRDSVIPSFRDSVIPSFRHSVNIWTSLLNNLSSFCLICFKFSPHLHHQTIHVWYEFRGQRVSIARVMGLFKSSYNMFAIVLKVHTL